MVWALNQTLSQKHSNSTQHYDIQSFYGILWTRNPCAPQMLCFANIFLTSKILVNINLENFLIRKHYYLLCPMSIIIHSLDEKFDKPEIRYSVNYWSGRWVRKRGLHSLLVYFQVSELAQN